jgi:hypothetical protein
VFANSTEGTRNLFCILRLNSHGNVVISQCCVFISFKPASGICRVRL